MHWGLHGILWGMVLSSLNIYLVNALLVSKYCHYPLTKQLKKLLPVFLLSLLVAVFVWLFNQWLPLFFGVTIVMYMIVYMVMAWAMRMEAWKNCIQIVVLFTKRKIDNN